MGIYSTKWTKADKIDLKSTDLGIPTGVRTEIEIPHFRKPLKRRIKELFTKRA